MGDVVLTPRCYLIPSERIFKKPVDEKREVPTNTVNEYVWASVLSWRMNDTIVAWPCEVTALNNGLRRGVMVSITRQRIFRSEADAD